MSRLAMPLTIAVMLLLVLVAIIWKPGEPPPSPPPAPQPLEAYVAPRSYVCPKARNAIVIDGRLDDAAWADVPWSEDFVDIEGDVKPKPRYRTRIKMTWDDQALYIAAELEEPHVRATMTRHDSYIFHEDADFEVFLDPNGDHHLYAELEMNALNTTWDLLLTRPYSSGGTPLDDWEIRGLKTAVHVDGTLNDPSDIDRGWTIEIAWPWAGLTSLVGRPVPPRPGDQWRINFSRVEWDLEIVDGQYRRVKGVREHNWVWSPQGRIDMHRPERWGYLQFAEDSTTKFVPDATGPARQLLQRIYDAQIAYGSKNNAYARSLADLGLAGLTHESINGEPRLTALKNWYEAEVKLHDGRRIRLRSDAHLTVD